MFITQPKVAMKRWTRLPNAWKRHHVRKVEWHQIFRMTLAVEADQEALVGS